MSLISRAMHRIFVYGTLKSGEPNAHLMVDSTLGKATFVGKAETVRKFPLLIASRFNVPYLLYKPGTGHRIIGEVYDVDDKLLQFLDEFENHPNYYLRQQEDVEFELDKRIEKAWVYMMMNFRDELLQKSLMANYSSKGPHGLQYVESEDTDRVEDLYT
ncbi:putative gamma-glutamylcyclotransferase CG2811 isoform X2 [Galendromus occidentalis]|uniref:Gamma-glutamylcyclotransferase family protein n=1 Tax=Galendromus occidentalis TaxID=34638 RepID=A0AAJ6QLU6_9ACAR|nr:putative gamma-glutamylcyclotransferase CG2811 isoform X2 [Galendromus occidentalis]